MVQIPTFVGMTFFRRNDIIQSGMTQSRTKEVMLNLFQGLSIVLPFASFRKKTSATVAARRMVQIPTSVGMTRIALSGWRIRYNSMFFTYKKTVWFSWVYSREGMISSMTRWYTPFIFRR